MKQVIEGVAYNTTTSTIVARVDYDNTGEGGTSGFLVLYQTRRGRFFLHEHDVVTYRDRAGTRQQRETTMFRPMSRDKAREWVTSPGVELHSDVLGGPSGVPEDATPEATIYARVPPSLKIAVEKRAAAERLSVNAYVTRCLEHFVKTGTTA